MQPLPRPDFRRLTDLPVRRYGEFNDAVREFRNRRRREATSTDPFSWSRKGDGLRISAPAQPPYDHSFPFKLTLMVGITRSSRVKSGAACWLVRSGSEKPPVPSRQTCFKLWWNGLLHPSRRGRGDDKI